MTSTHKLPKKITAVLAIIFLLPALYIFAIWIQVLNANAESSQAEKVSIFKSYFPAFIANGNLITYISMVCCIAAMILASKSFKQPIIFLRIMMFITVIAAALMLLLDIFQMM